ncbi:iron uptake transporter permease EfeU [Brachybacterium nesterenkovii]|uniref:Ferrous iron transport permease EfeU n=1 Tax=Brachybacterium nesterenkovii TaxID=47847 RepID=A0A1X6WX54_9MICO|nr:iron uptake transporter permease EfeU [Brachybacterium nesterenkovii]SLM90342.1 Ferrous iron transport permease EfeU [Brachybacterium nesterenkovii]
MFLPNLLIALREGLEASLVVGILVAYLVKSDRRDVLPKLWLGIGIAAAVPLVLGVILTWGPKTLTFQAQEIIGGVLSLLAVALTTGMIFWMSTHARAMKGRLETELDRSLRRSENGWGVVVIAMVAVGREGIETALILWATVKSSIESSVWATTGGIVVGFAIAIVLGVLIYRGALRLNLGRFFTWTGAFLILVAAGITAYGIGDLQEASVLPGWGTLAWDCSAHVGSAGSPINWLYTIGNAMFQVNAQPTVLQVIAWLAYFLPVAVIFWQRTRRTGPPRSASTAASAPADRAAEAPEAVPSR